MQVSPGTVLEHEVPNSVSDQIVEDSNDVIMVDSRQSLNLFPNKLVFLFSNLMTGYLSFSEVILIATSVCVFNETASNTVAKAPLPSYFRK